MRTPTAIQKETDAHLIRDERGTAAEMTYSIPTPSLMIIDHTYVRPDMQGEGLAKRLLSSVLADARAQSLRVLPLCTFAKAQMERNPEYHDLLYHT